MHICNIPSCLFNLRITFQGKLNTHIQKTATHILHVY